MWWQGGREATGRGGVVVVVGGGNSPAHLLSFSARFYPAEFLWQPLKKRCAVNCGFEMRRLIALCGGDGCLFRQPSSCKGKLAEERVDKTDPHANFSSACVCVRGCALGEKKSFTSEFLEPPAEPPHPCPPLLLLLLCQSCNAGRHPVAELVHGEPPSTHQYAAGSSRLM